jgi:hypothetical protein
MATKEETDWKEGRNRMKEGTDGRKEPDGRKEENDGKTEWIWWCYHFMRTLM